MKLPSLLLFSLAAPFLCSGEDLKGTWKVKLDQENRGTDEKWYAGDLSQGLDIQLPNSLMNAGIGERVDLKTPWIGDIIDRSFFTSEDYKAYRSPESFKVPFWLQPDTYFSGAAWYQKTFEVENETDTGTKEILFERVHWRSSVWIDSTYLGTNDSLSTSHRYRLPSGLAPGKHRITARVENGLCIDLGVNSHSISDHTQGNWNGIIGAIKLVGHRALQNENVRVYPDLENKRVRVQGKLESGLKPTGQNPGLDVAISYQGRVIASGKASFDSKQNFGCELAIPEAIATWDEFNPNLYELQCSGPEVGAVSLKFGFRDLTFKEQQWFMNRHPLFLRGTLECAVNPLTGYPPMDKKAWLRELSAAKEYGLNHLRFHSWCPPEAAFEAADEVGMYFQIEAASWSNQSTVLGSGTPNDEWIERESLRILAAYGNHPSFILMAYGNEPTGPNHEQWLTDWVKRRMQEDPRRGYTCASGWPNLEVNQYNVDPRPRTHQWGDGLKSRMNAHPPETTSDYSAFVNERRVPTVSHEIGEWCVYPNYKEIQKYTGPYKAKNFEIFKAKAEATGLLDRSEEFLHASGRLQVLCYKEEIESALRTPKMGGFALLGLQDFPGQGSALVGVLDSFWESKGYTSGEEFRRFCAPIVPLIRLPKRVFETGEIISATVDVAQYSDKALSDATLRFKIVTDTNETLVNTVLKTGTFPVGLNEAVAQIQFAPNSVVAASRLKIDVSVESAAGSFRNDWSVWVYPRREPSPHAAGTDEASIHLGFTKAAAEELNAGKTVIICADPKAVTKDQAGREVILGFTPIFWNTAWTGQQAPHTLGISCDPKSPLFRDFPTDEVSDWQWWYVIHNARPLLLGKSFQGKKPLVTVIDDWFSSRNLALIAEARVGRGKVIISGADLTEKDNLVKQQLLRSLQAYIKSAAFEPGVRLEQSEIEAMVR